MAEARRGHRRQRPSWRGLAAAGLAALAMVVALAVSAAAAEDAKAPLYNEKVYFPGTRSYFELVQAELGDSDRGPFSAEISWERARRKAMQRTYKGVHGRLAVVKDEATHRFLRTTFHPNLTTWIGLRYWCRYNKLQWVTGEFHDRRDYSRWDTVWARAGGAPKGRQTPSCLGPGWYWPVHYWSVAYGFRWNANDMQKEGFAYLVEYPTGKP